MAKQALFCPGRSLPYQRPNARLPDGCILACLFFGSASLCCISPALLSLHGSSTFRLLFTKYFSSNDRASASWVSSSRNGCRRSAPAARPLLICHLCSQSLSVNGTSPGDGRSGAAGISSALCAIGRDVVHVGAVPAYLPLHCAHIPANQPGNLMAAQAIHVIFPYTTALFYAKMMAVHTLSLLAAWLCAYSILPPGGCMNFFSFPLCVALDSIIHPIQKTGPGFPGPVQLPARRSGPV